MLDAVRWVLFLPAALVLVASVVASALGNLAGGQLSEFIGFATSGAMGAAALIVAGLWTAPRPTNVVKWTLISISTALGVLSAIGTMFGDDKLKVTTGLCMAIVSLGFSKVPPRESRRMPIQAPAPVGSRRR